MKIRYLIQLLKQRTTLFLDRILPENNFLEDWYKSAIGGKWDEIGTLQFEFLKEQGLTPSSYLLDIGCGSLRGGRFFIEYLDSGHYYGIDKENDLLDAGREKVVRKNGLEHKNPHLFCNEDFDYRDIDQKFDFGLAQSVFTHLPPELVQRCLKQTFPLLKPGGTFYATYWVTDDDIQVGNKHIHREGEYDTCKYPISWFHETASDIGYETRNIGDWGHPRGQQMFAFSRPE